MDKKIYIAVMVAVFAAFAVVFCTFPRSTYSELEKRELKRFPAFTVGSLFDGSFTAGVSSWFSDSEPYRDRFMALSMMVKDAMAVSMPGEAVRFHASDTPVAPDSASAAAAGPESAEYVNDITADENAKIANAGIIVVGEGERVRALMAFGGSAKGGGSYARLANAYKRALGDGVAVYCMAIPTATEFYCPDKARSITRPQLPVIRNIYSQLEEGVKKYIDSAKSRNLNVFVGTLLPIYGWRTYAPFREELRNAFNDWVRSLGDISGCIDFDRLLCDDDNLCAFAASFDSGDHLHPSDEAYKEMARLAFDFIKGQE